MLAKEPFIDRRVDIQKINDLPPLPAIANELLAALNNGEAEIEDIAEIIARDPALSAKLLGLANSAFFGFGRNMNNIAEAIINVLGLELVKGLSVGLIMSNSFDVNKCKGFDIERYWSNSLLAATLVRDINKTCKIDTTVNPGLYYLFGLLHNLGILVLADCFPEEMDTVFKTHEKEPERKLMAIENELLGIDHHMAGYDLAVKWNLPEEIYTVIQHHSDFDYKDKFYQVAQLTGYCSRIVQHWLQESHIEPRNNLIPNTLDIPVNKCDDIIAAVHNKIEDVTMVASKMSN